MKHTIERMKNPLVIIDNGKTITTNGYALIDESGHTIIIVYGEANRDAMSKYLNDDSDALNLKYKIIKL